MGVFKVDGLISATGTISATNGFIGNLTGNATSSDKLNTDAGSNIQPVYFLNGVPMATTYTLGKSVPSDAKFTDTTYSNATTSTAGLMSASDKSKLDGIAKKANKYVLPTAGSSLGGVKTTSTVTSTSGLTACPIIDGIPYYKDTNTTYSLSSFGITATAAELNYTDGVTSNIQTQLNGKAASSHNHGAGNITSGTLPVSRGGTGATSLTSGAALIGNGTSAISTRSITNMTTIGPIVYNTNLMTTNTLAFWNGSYDSNGSSNIRHLGVVQSGNWAATTIAINHGGTGATTAARARSNLGCCAVETKTASIANNGSATVTFSNTVKAVAVALYSSSYSRTSSGFWNANNSGMADNMYAFYLVDSYRSFVTISGSSVTIKNNTGVTGAYTITAFTA